MRRGERSQSPRPERDRRRRRSKSKSPSRSPEASPRRRRRMPPLPMQTRASDDSRDFVREFQNATSGTSSDFACEFQNATRASATFTVSINRGNGEHVELEVNERDSVWTAIMSKFEDMPLLKVSLGSEVIAFDDTFENRGIEDGARLDVEFEEPPEEGDDGSARIKLERKAAISVLWRKAAERGAGAARARSFQE